MRRYIISLCVLGISLTVAWWLKECSGGGTPPLPVVTMKDKGQLEINPPDAFQFKIAKGAALRRVFRVKNKTGGFISQLHILMGCSCADATVLRTDLDQGEETEVTITSVPQTNRFAVAIVASGAVYPLNLNFQFVDEYARLRRVVCEPDTILLEGVNFPLSGEAEVRVRVQDPKDWNDLQLVSEDKRLLYEFAGNERAQNREKVLHLTLHDAPIGQLNTKLYFLFPQKDGSLIGSPLSIRGNIRSLYKCIPAVVELGLIGNPEASCSVIKVESDPTSPPPRIRADGDWEVLSMRQINGRIEEVTVRVRGGSTLRRAEGRLVIDDGAGNGTTVVSLHAELGAAP